MKGEADVAGRRVARLHVDAVVARETGQERKADLEQASSTLDRRVSMASGPGAPLDLRHDAALVAVLRGGSLTS
ncbi:hypothetical protein [Anaeromyxobacter terrae]|uniref:hypothetical protein n=1 Tax=Anaeromyxobacter terrae TaxID=2925406 RepID=UPI001F55BB4A|nr:hypothetical protein [Anaeromyxobacter sp. SG22]